MFSFLTGRLGQFFGSKSETHLSAASTLRQVQEAYPHLKNFIFKRYGISLWTEDLKLPLNRFAEKHKLPPAQILFMELQMETRIQNVSVLSAREAKAKVDSTSDLVIFDCREPHEWEHHGRIPNAVFLTDENFLEKVKDLKEETPILTYCHFGVRSLNFAAQFCDLGFKNVATIRGGMDEWSLEVDSSLPRYHGDYC